jgi:hypothetical protein
MSNKLYLHNPCFLHPGMNQGEPNEHQEVLQNVMKLF